MTDYKDEEWLREQYVDRRRSTYDIAEECGVTEGNIRYWMDKYGIERRDKRLVSSIERGPLKVKLNQDGYEYVESSYDGRKTARIHRLAAVAWFGWEAVVGRDVHHRDPEGRGRPGIPWDNREEIVEPLSKVEHISIHANEQKRGKGGKYV